MTSRTVSVSFLLAITASIVVGSTALWQKIHVDIAPIDVDDEVRPHPHRQPPRQRRMLTNFDRQSVIDTLNRLRRSLSAPDMYYVTWDRELERHAADLTSGCKLRKKVNVFLAARFASGLTGYTHGPNIAGEIEKIYHQGSDSTFYLQIMSSHLMYVGCAVDFKPCDHQRPPRGPRHVFTCLFSYSRNLTTTIKSNSNSSPLCSQCDPDALWCDAGLCRIACRRDDVECVRNDWHGCETMCSNCATAINDSRCQCICYYDNDRRRCTGNAKLATKYQQFCRAATNSAATNDPFAHSLAGYLSLTICVLLAFVIICVCVICCITRCCSKKRRQRQSPGRREPDDSSAPEDATTSSTFVVGPPVILSPPSYVEMEGTDSRPPSYCQCLSYETPSAGGGIQLCSAADLPTPMSVRPTAPPPPSNDDLTSSSDQQQNVSQTPVEYRNPAFNDSGV